jgi:UPF0755 protein
MIKKTLFYSIFIFLIFLFFGSYSIYRQIFVAVGERTEKLSFEIKDGESAVALATHLKEQKIIKSEFFFKFYLKQKGLDKKIQSGIFSLTPPFTIPHVATSLSSPEKNERSITIIPGWDLRDIALYFEKEGIATQKEFFELVGVPAQFQETNFHTPFDTEFSLLHGRPSRVSLEGYFSPETIQIFQNEKLESILHRLLSQREKELNLQLLEDIKKNGHTVHEILTMASIIEKEVSTPEDRKKVSDLFWRRVEAEMGLQADSTVHYLSGREGDVFTKAKERQIDSLYNTYKYRGLPPGPISNPSVSSIEAAIYPVKNDAWYFLTTSDGTVIYSKTLDEHNMNVAKYLRN